MTDPQQQGFAIGVDLGTSNTVAVLRWPDGRTRPLLVDGVPIMPSGVYVDESGRLHVGRDAQRLAGLDPSRFEPNPKRRIDEPGVFLGDREVPTIDLLAAVLAAAARAAVEAVGFLPPAVLTYPASWGARRRDTLLTAARRAGWPPVRLVPEPVAAARYFADVLRRPVPVGACLAVFDFGGGTLDVAVVRNDNGQFTVLGSGGIEDLGGLDVDAALVEHLGVVLDEAAPQTWAALRQPQGTAQRRDRRLFWDDVRGAKEMLSRTTVAPVAVPGRDQAVHLTREELERVIQPLIRRAVWETGAVIQRCGLRPDQLAGLFLVGGSSRLPLAARLLHAELGVAPTVLEQPELPVAEGALAELAPVPAGRVASSAVPVSAQPVSPGFGAPAASPSSPATVPAAPTSGGGPHPATAMPNGPPPGPSVPGPRNRPWHTRRVTWIGVGAAGLVLVLVGVLGYVFLWRGRVAPVEFRTLETVYGVDLADAADIDSTYTMIVGDHVYYGWTTEGSFNVGVVSISDKRSLWGPKKFDGASEYTKWHLQAYEGKGLFLVGTESSTPGTLLLVDPDSGNERYRTAFASEDRIFPFESNWALFNGKGKELMGLSWAKGATTWRYEVKGGGQMIPVDSSADLRGPAMFWSHNTAPDLGAQKHIAHIGGDGVIRVVDGTTGKAGRTLNWVGDASYDHFNARDGKLFIGGNDPKYRVQMYDLTKGGEPDQVYSSADEKRKLVWLNRCGEERVCVVDATDSSSFKDAELAVIDLKQRKEVWRKPVPGGEQIIPVGSQILVTNLDEPASYLFTDDGRQLLKDEEKKASAGRVNAASVLFFAGALSSTSTANVGLVGVTASSGERVAVGQLPKVRGRSCSWSETVIACPTEEKLQLWRFGEG